MRISKVHLLKFARDMCIPSDNVELDYVQNWVLFGLSQTDLSETLAFKGGTCLRKAYFKDYRFSKDLDFTLLNDLSVKELKSGIKELLMSAASGCGIDFWIDEFESRERSFYVKVKWKSIQSGRDRKLEINITAFGEEFLTNNYPKRLVIHSPYISIEKDYYAELSCYTLEEILAEKIRTLFERKGKTGAWPRDLYDVWMLKGKVDIVETLRILMKKLEIRSIEIDAEKLMERKDVLNRTWKSSLESLIPRGNLPKFNDVFSDVVEFVRNLEGKLK